VTIKRQESVYKEISTARCYQGSSSLVVEKHSLSLEYFNVKKEKMKKG